MDYDNYFKRRGVKFGNTGTVPKYLTNYLPSNKDSLILDIGCGSGELLFALKRRGYKNVCGIDLDESAVKWVKRNGVSCEKVDVMQYQPQLKYDFIIMSHVLEHIPKSQTIQVLAHIREELLNEGGKLFVRVPNAQSYTGCYWAYEDFSHCTLFTAGSLSFVLQNAGFRKCTLLDQDGLSDVDGIEKICKRVLLFLYTKKLDFGNYITNSSFHKPSLRVYTYELKVISEK